LREPSGQRLIGGTLRVFIAAHRESVAIQLR
jgi:hypothetical protein